MMAMRVTIKTVNFAGLHESLTNILGNAYGGLSQDSKGWLIHLKNVESQPMAQQVVDQHNPAQLTQKQQQAQARQLALATARQQNSVGVDANLLNDSNPVIQALARKIAWLEWEMRDLREG